MLRYRADWRTLFFVVLYFAAAVAPWFLWDSMSKLEAVLWMALNCYLSFTCAVIVHNTIHVPIFKSKTLNRIFQVVLSLTYGHSTSAFVPGHNFSHHKYTQKERDIMRTTKATFRWNILNQLFFFFIMSGDIIKSEMRFAKRMYSERPKWFWQFAFELALVNVVKLGMLLVDWQRFLLFLFIPHQYAAWGIVGTNYFQHDGVDENHPYNHSRNFTGKFLNFLLFNNGFHGAHHEKPNLHWSLLPEYHEKHIRPHIHPNLDRSSLLAYLFETHIYPAKRLDYLGNPIQLPAQKIPDIDWVAEVNVGAHKSDMATV